MSTIFRAALKNAVLTALYIVVVAGFMYFGALIKIGKTNTIFIPIAFLLLFVCSAAITGFLMFGNPAQLYLDGKKKEALSLVTYTLIFFSMITVIFLILLILFSR